MLKRIFERGAKQLRWRKFHISGIGMNQSVEILSHANPGDVVGRDDEY
jgi:hypothetical protein